MVGSNRKALVVGVNYYEEVDPLAGCTNDAANVAEALATNSADGTPNFDVVTITASDEDTRLGRRALKEAVEEVFAGKTDIALFYFAGHGHVESTGGYLLTSECAGDDGLSLSDVMTFANQSEARHKVIILDSCHSGEVGTDLSSGLAELSEGMTILTACTKQQYATERDGQGLFTSLLVDGLSGPASNIRGYVTPGALYAHIDQSLGPSSQRPVFKTNIEAFCSLRSVPPAIELADLQKIDELFSGKNYPEFKLDETFEPEMKGRSKGMRKPDPANCAKFAILQKYNRVNLVVPVGTSQPHMWHAAMERKSCRLTPLGEHYRRLKIRNRLF